MNNPIPRSRFFATRSLEDIQADIEGLPAKEKALVYQYVMMTLNACHELVREEIESSKSAW